MHPFEAVVIALAAFFALCVVITVGMVNWRGWWNRPLVRLPPPKDE